MPEISLRSVFAIPRSERRFAGWMSLYFFFVIASFWILKPIKKALFIQFYDDRGLVALGRHLEAAEAELLAKMLNMFVAFAAVVVFTWLARRLRRQQLTYVFTAAFSVGYVIYTFALARPAGLGVWSFYLFGDLFSTLMVPTFFAFLNDSVTANAAKRMYGPVGFGGVLGGVAGSSVQRLLIESMTFVECLWLCVALACLIVMCAYAASRCIPVQAGSGGAKKDTSAQSDSDVRGNVAWQGAALVWRSPYLLAVAAIVGIYEIVSTLMDFQFTSTVSHLLDGEAIGKHFSAMYAITNVSAMLIQLFVTSPVMTRFGVGVALLVLPAAAMLGSGAFMLVPTLWTASFLNTADNAFSYSINQSAKEVLYVPTSRGEKYKGKAFIDMFVLRAAKATAVVVGLGIGAVFAGYENIRWISLVTLPLLAAWVAAALYAGRKFRELSSER